jgi:hypothetical protein
MVWLLVIDWTFSTIALLGFNQRSVAFRVRFRICVFNMNVVSSFPANSPFFVISRLFDIHYYLEQDHPSTECVAHGSSAEDISYIPRGS